MELKKVFYNGNIVVASYLNNINIFIFLSCKIQVQQQTLYLFFLKDVMIAQKIKFLKLFYFTFHY
jgi:hypothetical protein